MADASEHGELLGFATARVPGLSVTRSLTALVSFLAGAVLGGRIMSRASSDSHFRFAHGHSCWKLSC